MNTAAKNKTLISIIVLLLLTNIAVLSYFMFFNKSHRHGGDKQRSGFIAALQKEVGFTEAQMKQFNEIRVANWEKARSKMDDIRRIKSNLFELTKQPVVADSTVQLLADSIGMLQKEVELNLFKHFKAIRAICTPEQLPKLDSLLKKNIIRPGKGLKPAEAAAPEKH